MNQGFNPHLVSANVELNFQRKEAIALTVRRVAVALALGGFIAVSPIRAAKIAGTLLSCKMSLKRGLDSHTR